MEKTVIYNLIKSIKQNTNSGGVNFIPDFTKDSDMNFLSSNELLSLYSDWDILFSEEKKIVANGSNNRRENFNMVVISLFLRKS